MKIEELLPLRVTQLPKINVVIIMRTNHILLSVTKIMFLFFSSPKSGSFLRKANLGVSLMAAIRDRYGKIDDEHAGVITDDLFVVGAKNKQTIVEMVGARKVNDLQRYEFR